MIIAIANQKGGVGKTTTALNVSAALAFSGKNTLLVDTDPQANCTISFVKNKDEFTVSMYDVMVDNVNIEEIIKRSAIPGLDIAISKISMAKLESSLMGEIDAHFKMRDVLDTVKNKYDFIIIDTPPTLGLITLNALVASECVIIPIQSSYLCLEGTDDLLETIEKVKRVANNDIEILGVLITLHDKRTNISKDVEDRIKSVFGKKVFKNVISKSVKLEESPAYKESIFTYAPKSVGAIQYKNVAKEIISRAKKK
ncbi:MAG: AAA family ATPase [Candidatus Aminicenantes bacterium]|nr:AAA family ATPase [Candidatus Aminicenantes bacterium]